MKRCARCGRPRQDGSYFDSRQSHHPTDVCKGCIFHPDKALNSAPKPVTSRATRTQQAIRYIVKHEQASRPFVYLLRARKFFKIGFSADVCKRVRQLSTGSAYRVEIVAIAPGEQSLEQELHVEFSRFRKRGEWFSRSGADQYIKRFAELQGSMVFLPGYLSSSPPTSSGDVASA